jgi:L-histidine N-alpha-methyltransferase
VILNITTDARREQLRRDVRRGLTTQPKSLPPKYFYDARGSELFTRSLGFLSTTPRGRRRRFSARIPSASPS